MSITVSDRMKLYKHFLDKGSLLVRNNQHETNAILNINNKKLRQVMQSLRDQGYITEYCSWRQLYCFATESGMQFFDSECKIADKIDDEIILEEVQEKAE